jgi:hypothetical protein
MKVAELIFSPQKVGHRADELFVGIWLRQKRTALYKLFHAVGKGSTTGAKDWHSGPRLSHNLTHLQAALRILR